MFRKIKQWQMESKMKESVSVSPQLWSTLCSLWTVASQTLLSMEFSRQEYWNRQPFPSPEDLPDPGIIPASLALQADSLPSEPPGKPKLEKNPRSQTSRCQREFWRENEVSRSEAYEEWGKKILRMEKIFKRVRVVYKLVFYKSKR